MQKVQRCNVQFGWNYTAEHSRGTMICQSLSNRFFGASTTQKHKVTLTFPFSKEEWKQEMRWFRTGYRLTLSLRLSFYLGDGLVGPALTEYSKLSSLSFLHLCHFHVPLHPTLSFHMILHLRRSTAPPVRQHYATSEERIYIFLSLLFFCLFILMHTSGTAMVSITVTVTLFFLLFHVFLLKDVVMVALLDMRKIYDLVPYPLYPHPTLTPHNQALSPQSGKLWK